MNRRIQKLASCFPAQEIDAYFITDDANIRYLTDFPASESWLVVFPRQAYYLTDARFTQDARRGLRGVTVREYRGSMGKELFSLLAKRRPCRVGFDERFISVAHYRQLLAECPSDVKLVARNHAVEALREIKDQSEIARIRACLDLNYKAYRYLKKFIRPGCSEKDLLLKLERYVRSKGAGFSFPPIIASGPNASSPHARVSDRKIRDNEPVLVDMGIDIDGYKSDLTRMFFVGKMRPFIRTVNDAVAQAQQAAIAAIRPGVTGAEVDRQARNSLKKKGLAGYFTHSLGHGVGVEIHEAPRLAPTSTAVLAEGMVVTVEPGVYLPGKFGVRIEDMVLVTGDGCEVLSGNFRI